MMASTLPALRAPSSLARWWALKGPNERRIVITLGVLIVGTIGWLAVWQPVQRDVVAMRVTTPAQRSALANAQRTAEEIAGLSRTTPATGASDAKADLERVLSQHGLRAAVTQVDWQE